MQSTRSHRFGRALMAVWLAAATLPALAPDANAQSSFAFTNRPPQPLPRRASIILIVADGLGYGDLSCYGQTKYQTPNLDRLATDGVRFTDFYAGDAASSPSWASLMLGKDPAHLRQRADVDIPLAPGEMTVAQILKQSGYHTGWIGEWLLGNNTAGAPWNNGFDEFAGYFDPGDAGNFYADYIWRYAPRSMLTTNNLRDDFVGKEMIYPNTGGKKGQYIPDLYAKAALNFIQNNVPDQFNRFRPFFLVVNFKIPGTGTGQVPTDAPYSDEPWPQPEKNRAAMVARLDGYIGQLREQLRKQNLTNDAVIFFTSDTGPEKGQGADPKFFKSAGPFRGGRGELYEGGLRVPMIAAWPGKIPAGRVNDFTWAAWDFLPTAAGIALTPSPTNLGGISILPALLGQTQTNRPSFFYWTLRARAAAQAARLDDWKIVRPKPDAPWELYNLETDPGETRNVADKNPGVISQFKALLQEPEKPGAAP